MNLDITFEEAPFERLIGGVKPGGSVDAAELLAVTQESEDALEEALEAILQKKITLDLSTLPALPASGETARRLQLEKRLSAEDALLTGLGENDPLRVYLEELSQIPAAGDEEILAGQYLGGNENVAQRLADLSLGRVVELAREHTGKGVLLLDLIQEGSLGLWQSILCYTGGNFAQHRDWYIQAFLAAEVLRQAHNSGLGSMLKEQMQDYLDIDGQLLSQLGRNPTLEEIAEKMRKTADETALLRQLITTARSLDRITGGQQVEDEPEQAVEDTAYFQSRQRVNELLGVLTPLQAQVLSLRFGLEGGQPLEISAVAARLNISLQEATALEQKALETLRKGGSAPLS